MTKLSQKEAVYRSVISVCGGKPQLPLTKDQRQKVKETLINMFIKEEVKLSSSIEKEKLAAYASSLISNWLKKDNRFKPFFSEIESKNINLLNKYKKDVLLSSLLQYKKSLSNPEDIKDVDLAISTRLSELNSCF